MATLEYHVQRQITGGLFTKKLLQAESKGVLTEEATWPAVQFFTDELLCESDCQVAAEHVLNDILQPILFNEKVFLTLHEYSPQTEKTILNDTLKQAHEISEAGTLEKIAFNLDKDIVNVKWSSSNLRSKLNGKAWEPFLHLAVELGIFDAKIRVTQKMATSMINRFHQETNGSWIYQTWGFANGKQLVIWQYSCQQVAWSTAKRQDSKSRMLMRHARQNIASLEPPVAKKPKV